MSLVELEAAVGVSLEVEGQPQLLALIQEIQSCGQIYPKTCTISETRQGQIATQYHASSAGFNITLLARAISVNDATSLRNHNVVLRNTSRVTTITMSAAGNEISRRRN